MKVWELIAALSQLQAGAEVVVKLRSEEIDGQSKCGWLASVDDFVDTDSGGDPLVIITLVDDLTEIISQWKKATRP